VIKLGGLHVVGTERHEARRIDNQLRGRAGRQGDPGSSRFYVSLEDDIMRLFGGEQIAKIMTAFKLPEDTPIEHGMVSKAIENAQVKVETHNFDIRKHLVEYDDVANKQREIIYGMRMDILMSAEDKEIGQKLKKEIKEKLEREISSLIFANFPEGKSKPNYEQIIKELTTIVPFDDSSVSNLLSDAKKFTNPEKLSEFFSGVLGNIIDEREKSLGEKQARDIEKFTSLSVIDTLWIQHLDTLDDLREGIGLRAAGQRDPLVEYKQEAFSLFEKLIGSIDYEIIHRIFKVQISQEQAVERLEEQGVEVHEESSITNPQKSQAQISSPVAVNDSYSKNPNEMTDDELEAEIARLEEEERTGKSIQTPNNPFSSQRPTPLKVEKIGRNDPCPCGSGLKFKKCGLINSPEHKG
jgi:preprotein translocase subunit SecA